MADPASPPLSHDAVVIIPGIMGSALKIVETGELIWGLRPRWYWQAWTGHKVWRELALDDDEMAGTFKRVAPAGLLDLGAAAPILGGFEPYGPLVRRLRSELIDKDAILSFAYDWRLPVAYNASLLAPRMVDHLAAWRARDDVKAAEVAAGREAKLVVIAHSMGGLVYRSIIGNHALTAATRNVRAVLTLGTPFSGAPKAMLTISNGTGGPFRLPRRRLRDMARTLPGLYDLLPLYPAVEVPKDFRALTVADVVAVGGTAELAKASLEGQGALRRMPVGRQDSIHYPYLGGFQPTPTSLRIDSGVAHPLDYTYARMPDGAMKRDADLNPLVEVRAGDGTVPLRSGQLADAPRPTFVTQQHGSLAKVSETLSEAAAILRGDTEVTPDYDIEEGLAHPSIIAARRHTDGVGVDAPSMIRIDTDEWVPVVNAEPASLTGSVSDADGTGYSAPLTFDTRDGGVGAVVHVPEPGTYRIVISQRGLDPVTQIMMALPDEEP